MPLYYNTALKKKSIFCVLLNCQVGLILPSICFFLSVFVSYTNNEGIGFELVAAWSVGRQDDRGQACLDTGYYLKGQGFVWNGGFAIPFLKKN